MSRRFAVRLRFRTWTNGHSRANRDQPQDQLGKPILRGARIAVELIVRKTVEGADEQALLLAHPNLKREDIQAALQYAADAVAREDIAPGATG